MNEHIGIIGGSGFYDIPDLTYKEIVSVSTPYGDVELLTGIFSGKRLSFLCRHGMAHNTPPHKINYRANIYALKTHGVSAIVATNAVGGIGKNCAPGSFIVPDQVIDYSWGREHSFYDEFSSELAHVDFSEPFDAALRMHISSALKALDLPFENAGTYACTQGPRMETSAEIKRLAADGNTVVGMTLMPEAALAREAHLRYASLCFSVNWAAGVAGSVSMIEIRKHLSLSVANIRILLPLIVERVRKAGELQ